MAVINLEVYWPYWMIQHHSGYYAKTILCIWWNTVQFSFFFFPVKMSDGMLFMKILAVDVSEKSLKNLFALYKIYKKNKNWTYHSFTSLCCYLCM